MEDDFYTYIGIAVVWCVKYIFIPFGVGFSVKIAAKKVTSTTASKAKKETVQIKPFK